eukprot:SAG11_NODE_3815_length_2211_cov_1.319602_2_plen_59_part_00
MSRSTPACFIGWQVPVIDWKIVYVEIDIGENGAERARGNEFDILSIMSFIKFIPVVRY